MSAEDDDTLWDTVKKTVKPMRPSLSPGKSEQPAKRMSAAAKTKKPSPAPTTARPSPMLPSLAALDRRMKTRIVRGSTDIEARLDLHGYKRAEAKDRLTDFLERAQGSGKSLVLVITGKGTFAPEGAERGVLKREVPMWLASPGFRPLVIGFEEAASRHGGAGALYVRVRRRR